MKRGSRSKVGGRWKGGNVAKRARRRTRTRTVVPRRLRMLTHALAVGIGVTIGLAGARPLLDRLGPEPLQVRTVSVIGQERVDAPSVAQAAAIAPDATLAELDLEAIRDRVMGHSWIRTARVMALPPDRVLIAIEEREPVAIARFGESERRFVDPEGVPFAAAPANATGAELHGIGEARADLPHPLLRQGVALLEAWRARGLAEPSSVALAGPVPAALPTVVDARGRRVLVGPGEPELKLARLGRLEAAGTRVAQAADEIDLRFAGQVILRSDPSEDGAEMSEGRGDAARSETNATGSTGGQGG